MGELGTFLSDQGVWAVGNFSSASARVVMKTIKFSRVRDHFPFFRPSNDCFFADQEARQWRGHSEMAAGSD